MDKVEPGIVDWKKVEKKPKNVHAKVANCNYAVTLGKAKPFAFSLVGIGGADIVKGVTKLILAIVWQLMRHHVIKFLSSMSAKQLTEKDVLEWANAKVAGSGVPKVKTSSRTRPLSPRVHSPVPSAR